MKLLSVANVRIHLVRLVVPTDFEILEAMSDAQRQTAPNLAEILDRKRQYMNDRLSALASMGLVRKVGPANTSGMYEITSKGLAALEYRDQYTHDRGSDFAKLIESKQPEYRNPEESNRNYVLKEVYDDGSGTSVSFQELSEDYGVDTEHLEKMLEELESLGLIEQREIEGNRYYIITRAGEMVVDSLSEPQDSIIDDKYL